MSRRSTELDGFSRGGHRENSRVRFATSLLAAFISLCLGQAQAQSVPSSQPSVRSLVDANGVDLMTGYYVPTVGPDLSIGTPGAGGLSVSRKHLPTLPPVIKKRWFANIDGGALAPTADVPVTVGLATETFTNSSGTYTADLGTGSTLTYNSGSNTYAYTTRDGTVYTFGGQNGSGSPVVYSQYAITSVAFPNGEVDTYTYATGSFVSGGVTNVRSRVQSITNNYGYQIQIQYASNTLTSSNYETWRQKTTVTAINNAIDYCSPTAVSCSGFSTTWPTVTYGIPSGGSGLTVTDALGHTTTYVYDSTGNVTSVQSAGGVNTTLTYNSSWQVPGPTTTPPSSA